MYDHELEEQRWKLHFTTTNYMHVTSERKSVRSGVLKAKGLNNPARTLVAKFAIYSRQVLGND